MRWTERQRAMLQAIGVRLFEREAQPAAARPPVRTEPVEVQASTSSARTVPVALEETPGRSQVSLTPSGGLTRSGRPGGVQQTVERVAVVPRPDTSTLDWDALRSAVADCQACALAQSRQRTVFGVGHRHAHWMIVGEAPGEQEDRQGEPFVGTAGQLLDNMLHALGLTRDEAPPERQVFIVNTLKCRPPKNRNPDAAETAQCAPFLERQIALVQPRIILAMGRFAAQALLASDEPLGRLRGRIHQYHGVPVVVTYHPAYLLRSLADKARAWEDLCLAATVVPGG
ncbi:MAG: uracil-DNA glycosylase [Burkholderiaceae bacterium]|nr:uracil-DNA glycosylase [Burkholderiaceae bacterium]